MPHQIDDLRNHLFETLAALKDKDNPMDLDRAKAIADVGKVIVESAKVEVNFLKVTGAGRSTGFLPMAEETPLPARPPAPALKAAPPAPPKVSADGKFEVMFDGSRGQSIIGDRESKRA